MNQKLEQVKEFQDKKSQMLKEEIYQVEMALEGSKMQRDSQFDQLTVYMEGLEGKVIELLEQENQRCKELEHKVNSFLDEKLKNF